MNKLSQVVFVSGNNRTGTTVLSAMLGSLPGAFNIGELKNYEEFARQGSLCSCGEIVYECPFWKEVFACLGADPRNYATQPQPSFHRKLFNISAAFNTPGLMATRLLGAFSHGLRGDLAIIESYMRLQQAARDVSGARFLVDSSKLAPLAKHLWLRNRSSIKVIYMIRDGRGFCNSVMHRLGLTMTEAATLWRNSELYMHVLYTGIASADIMRVKYEDLCRDTEGEMRRICVFTGLPMPESSFVFTKAGQHYIGGSPTVKNEGRPEIVLKLDEKWRETLSEADLREFNRIAGWLNRSYGYK